MSMNRFAVALTTFVCATQLATYTHATTVTQLTSVSQLSPNDTAFVDKDAVGTTYAGPSVAFSNGNDRLTFSRTSGAYETDQANFNYGDTAFANGTVLVGAGGFQGAGDGKSITITFAVPVIQFGMNIEDFEDAGTGSGKYTILFDALDPSGNLIANTIYDSVGCSDNSCLSFEGLTVSGDSISSITFSDSGVEGGSNNLMFGNIKYAPAGTALQAPPPAVTPEPSSFLLLGSGLLGLAALGRRAGGFLRPSSAR